MNNAELKKDFLFHLELYFRNFGNEWTLDSFPDRFKRRRKMLDKYLKELEQLGIIAFIDGEKFEIKRLPSEMPH